MYSIVVVNVIKLFVSILILISGVFTIISISEIACIGKLYNNRTTAYTLHFQHMKLFTDYSHTNVMAVKMQLRLHKGRVKKSIIAHVI